MAYFTPGILPHREPLSDGAVEEFNRKLPVTLDSVMSKLRHEQILMEFGNVEIGERRDPPKVAHGAKVIRGDCVFLDPREGAAFCRQMRMRLVERM
eukprot:g4933.t1